MTASTPDGDAGLKERFYRHFQQEVAALRQQIEGLNSIPAAGSERNDAIDGCLASIDRLSHEVQDASSYIPAYDQRSYSLGIKELSEKLQQTRNSFNPPKKFSFKNRKAPTAAPAPEPSAKPSLVPKPLDKLSRGEHQSQQESTPTNIEDGMGDIDPNVRVQKPSFPNAAKINIANHNNLHIVVPTSASHATGSGTVANVEKCVIDLSAPTTSAPFSALYLKDIKNSLIITGRVAGAIHITSLENTVLVTACRQFRMHSSKNVDIYLHSASRPIIEDCHNVRFAPIPTCLETSELAESANQWNQIDDFKWLKAGPSPNFGLLPEEERIGDDVWKRVTNEDEGMGIEKILGEVKVPA